jgi:hypothetical protein
MGQHLRTSREEAQAVSDINPIYADGPLKGGEFKPPNLRSGVVTMDPADGDYTRYSFHKFVLFGRVIWIGATGPVDEISDADLFDLIVSDRAKQASEQIAEQWTS